MHITRDSHFRHGHSTPLLATTAVGLVGAMLLTGHGIRLGILLTGEGEKL